VRPDEIAVSVPDLKNLEPRLRQEFRLRDLAGEFRAGRPLADFPVGRWFDAMQACRASRWSYRALKNLLLDQAWPWKRPDDIRRLLDFGLAFRCVAGYIENGREIDIWLETFDHLTASGAADGNVRIVRAIYSKLKADILAITSASSLIKLRDAVMAFKANQFAPDGFDARLDAVFARAVEELSALTAIEDRLAGLSLADPAGFFRAHLRSVNYVFQQSGSGGVRIYDYRVAAGCEPRWHFIVNAGQDATAVQASAAGFLREDRKRQAAIADRDLSADFIAAYARSGATVVFTAAKRGAGGYAAPQRALADARFEASPAVRALGDGFDPLAAESAPPPAPGRVAASIGSAAVDRSIGPSSVQRRGYARDAERRAGPAGPDLRFGALPPEAAETASALAARLRRDPAAPRLSPSDLNGFAACPFAWLLKTGWRIGESQSEIATIDQRDLGSLYHAILADYFTAVRADAPRFRWADRGRHLELMAAAIDGRLAAGRASEGAFQEAVYAMLRPRMAAALTAFLDAVGPELDGCAVVGSELGLRFPVRGAGTDLAGKADLVLRAASGGLILIDFKTGVMPSAADLVSTTDGPPADLQLAAYIRLLEAGGDKVERAFFYSLDLRKIQAVVDDAAPADGKRKLPLPRAAYQCEVDAVDAAAVRLAAAVDAGAFPVPPPAGRQVCAACPYRAVCRLPYERGQA
jgi:CRISPR/Cas system-associated exonuclease Cas4 (RecB family)